jgi:hypothetical protein
LPSSSPSFPWHLRRRSRSGTRESSELQSHRAVLAAGCQCLAKQRSCTLIHARTRSYSTPSGRCTRRACARRAISDARSTCSFATTQALRRRPPRVNTAGAR